MSGTAVAVGSPTALNNRASTLSVARVVPSPHCGRRDDVLSRTAGAYWSARRALSVRFLALLHERVHCDCARLFHRFRLLFGVSVDVADMQQGTFGLASVVWRKSFGDPLYLQAADSDADGTPRFEMAIAKVPEIFNGDGCTASIADPRRFPIRKTAIISIRCKPCLEVNHEANDTAGYGHICNVEREDGCTLRLDLALRCPPRELVYAPTLDVGTTAGASDIIHAGAAATCSPKASRETWSSTGTLDTAPALALYQGQKTVYVSLTHSSLEFAPASVSVDSSGCFAWVEGESAAVGGGTQYAGDGPQSMDLNCECDATTSASSSSSSSSSSSGWRKVTMTLALRPVDFTSPVVTFQHVCSQSQADTSATD